MNRKLYLKAVTRIFFMSFIMMGILFKSAGAFAWWNAWCFLTINIVLITVLAGLALHKSPELIHERMTASAKAKSWDKILVPILALILPVLMLLIAGLDKRFQWSNMDSLISILAILPMLVGIAITYSAMASNPFFSSHVRIQNERNHQVITRGPYRFIRHPGYLGAMLYNLATPFLLASLWALPIAVLFIIVFIFRTSLEDMTLKRELDGYQEYCAQTPYRLIPFVW